MKRSMLLLLIASLFCLNTIADDSVGCGLGQMVAPKKTLISATTRSITNVTFSSQLFGITTGTSGCAQHQFVMQENRHLYDFAIANLDKIEYDVMRGEGEFLTTVTSNLCGNPAQSRLLAKTLHKNYAVIFDSKTTAQSFYQKVQQQTNESNQLAGCRKTVVL